MLGDELQRLQLAEKLVRVAPDVAGVDLVGDDLALGIHDERPALRHAVALDEHIEIAREHMRRIAEHRERDVLDAVGMVMPSLVHEMRIRRDGVDLAALRLEFRVAVLQVLELRRADEREIRRIEEEHAPLPEHILARHRAERIVLERLDRKLADLFVDK